MTRISAHAPGPGTVRSALRIAEFRVAETTPTRCEPYLQTIPKRWRCAGDSLWASGRFDEAEAAFREALDRDPDQPRGRNGLAKALASRNQLEAALAEAEAGLRAAPDDAEIHHTRGYVLERLRRYDEAASEYQTQLSLMSPGDRGDRSVVHPHRDQLPAIVQGAEAVRDRGPARHPAAHRAVQARERQGGGEARS